MSYLPFVLTSPFPQITDYVQQCALMAKQVDSLLGYFGNIIASRFRRGSFPELVLDSQIQQKYEYFCERPQGLIVAEASLGAEMLKALGLFKLEKRRKTEGNLLVFITNKEDGDILL